MPDNNEVTQQNIDAGGDVVGRDKINVTKNYFSPPIFHEDSILKKLLLEHEEEKETDPEYRKFSDELNKFFIRKINPNKRNLEEKLSDGGRDHLIDKAMELKERATKKIQKYSHYKSAQEIYSYLLTEIHSAFLHECTSKIKSGNFQVYEIDDIVKTRIIEPFLHNLSGSSLCIEKHELYGLLYFLTGNCYIEWD